MGKKILTLVMLAALLIPFSCKYDDTDLWNSVNDLDNRVEKLEEAVQNLNSNVKTLSDLMNGKLFIESIEDKGNGVRVIHFINAAGEQSTMEIRDGKDGQNGADGKDGVNGTDGKDGADGKDGKDGQTPVVSVRQDSDGHWYWTVNGDYILDQSGNKIRANGIDGINGADGKDGQDGKDGADGKDGINGADGKDGQDGKDGADGKDGKDGKDGADGKDGEDAIAPAFRINAKGNWEMSLDQGLTWLEVGQATGKDGDAFFQDAQTSADGKYAYLTLVDGTVLTFEIYKQFGISFDLSKTIVQEGQSREIKFTVTGMTPETQIEAIGKNGWEADAELGSDGKGTLTVTAPDKTGYGKVIVLLTDGGDRTIMRTLTILAGTVKASTSSVEVDRAGGTQTLSVETNIDFTVSVADDAKDWVSLVETSRADATHTETFQIKVEPSEAPSPRSALLSLKSSDGTVVETILVVQRPVSFDESDLVFRVDPAISTNSKGVVLPIYAITAPVTIDWGDGEKTELTAALTTSTRYPAHKYEDTGRQYNVVVKGNVTNLQGTSASYVAGVTEIAQWGTANVYTIVKIKSSAITYLPGTKGNEFAKVTAFDFASNTKLVNLSPDLFKGATSVKTLSSCFNNCTALPNVPSGLFKDLKAVTNFSSVFKYCYSLSDLPDGLFDGLSKITTIANAFDGCKSLESVPAGLFKGMPANMTLGGVFRGCESLTTVPGTLFASFTSTKSVSNVFENCYSLNSVPAELFQPMKGSVTNIDGLFKKCTSLKTVPANLFDGCTKITSVKSTFTGCSALEEIPAGFFDFAHEVIGFMNLFDGCSSLRTIGSGFVNNFKNGYTGTSTFGPTAMFRDCESLTNIPLMFNEETMKRFDTAVNMFQNCKSLESFPEGFFTGFGQGIKSNKPIAISNFNMTFSGCTKLKTLPLAELFNSPGGLQASNFTSTLANCPALTTAIPAYELVVGEETYKVYPWERGSYSGHSNAAIKAAAAAVFGTRTNVSGSDFATGSEKIPDWSTIPASWGGGDDGITAAPDLEVKITHPEKREYYTIVFDFFGKQVTNFVYYLGKAEDIKKYLPRYGNSLEQMVRTNGTRIYPDDYQSHFYAQLNSEVGGGLIYDSADPETEYGMIVLVENSKGHKVCYFKATTAPIPEGSSEFEAYCGTWTVKPAGTVTDVSGVDENGNQYVLDTPVPTFDITIKPLRTDSAYTVSGWGYTQFADISELHAYLNPETKAIEFYNGSKGNVSVMPNFEFSKNDNPDAIFSVYNVAYCGIIEDPHTFQYSYWSSGSSIECILAGNYMQSLDRIMLIGQKSNYNSTPEYGDVYWSGLEATLGMGSMSTSQIWTPVQVVRPECRFQHNGKEYTLYQHGPYTLERKAAAETTKAKAPARFTATTSTKSLTAKVR